MRGRFDAMGKAMGKIKRAVDFLSVFAFNFLLLNIFFISFNLSFSYGETKTSKPLMKSIIYFENGEYKKAYDTIRIYESEMGDSAIFRIIKTVAEGDDIDIDREYKIIPEIEEKIKERMKYEKAKKLFEKGNYEEAKKILFELEDKRGYKDGVKFILSNINLLEGRDKTASKLFKEVDESKIDKIKYRKLGDEIYQRTSDIYIKSYLSSSAFFSNRGDPFKFEEDRFLKTWDIISELQGMLKAEFIKSERINPFIMYSAEGEFYTELDGIFVQSFAVGSEYNLNFPIGLQYSFILSTLGSRIFSTKHEIFPYIFPTRFFFLGAKIGFETKNDIPEREGQILSFYGGVKYDRKVENLVVGGLFLIDIGKRLAQTERFSEFFIYPYLEIFSKLGDFSVFFSSYINAMLFPAEFDGRKRDVLWLASPGISFNTEFLRWDIIRLAFEGNLSDRFGWTRFKIGTSFFVEL